MGGLVGGIVGTVGGLISGGAASGAAGAAAGTQREIANQAARMSQFTPVGIKTGFGQSTFGFDNMGRLNSAGYTLTPEMQAIQGNLLSQAGAYDTQQLGQAAQPLYGGANAAFGGGQNLFNLGSQYLASSPEQARQDYIANQQALLAPGQEQQLAGLRNQQFQTGRTGLATGGTSAGGLAQTNPEMAAYYNAIANSNRQIAAGAEQAAQQRQVFGAGLQNQGLGMFGTGGTLLGQVPALTSAGYAPLQTQLGLANTIEGYGQQALTLGSDLGARSASAGAQAANQYSTGMSAANQMQRAANSYSPLGSALSGLGSAVGGMTGGSMGGVGDWFNGLIGGGGNSNNTSYFGGSGGGWIPQADTSSTAGLFGGSSAYNQLAGWSM